MRTVQERELVESLPRTGQPLTPDGIQAGLNGQPPETLGTIAHLLSLGMFSEVMGGMFTVTPRQAQSLHTAQNDQQLNAQVNGMLQSMGATPSFNGLNGIFGAILQVLK